MAASERDILRRYLATHDVPCPTCGYNLRGLKDAACPECGTPVPAWVCPESREALDRRLTAEYLRDHDLICRYCKANLRGSQDGVCPGCGRVYLARGYPPPGPGALASREPRPLMRSIVCGLTLVPAFVALALMIAVLIVVARLSIWASP